MAEGKPEKICVGDNSPRYKKWLKRVAKRLRRRQEKIDPESAPKKNEYDGWSI